MQTFAGLLLIKGKPTLSADAMGALVQSREVCTYLRCVESTEKVATFETMRKGHPEPTRLSYTMADAVTAGLAGGDNWRKHPKAMLRARALSAIARLVYPDLLLGVYDPDELTPQPERDVTPVVLPAAEAIAARLKAPAASPPRDADFTPHPAEVRPGVEQGGGSPAREGGHGVRWIPGVD